MSGTIVNNVARASGTIAATPGGLDWSAAVVTASTVTVEAGRGYFINTTSNACTITLPASAEIGDQIVIADYARTWATNAVTLDSNGLNFQGNDDTYTVNYETVGQSLNIVFSYSTQGWLPVSDDAVADEPVAPPTQRAIFAFGDTGSLTGISNLVNSSGVVASDVSAVGTARQIPAGAGYGTDKAIFAYGQAGSGNINTRNLVNSSGVIASDASGAGTARYGCAGATYGTDKAIVAYGYAGSANISLSNLINNSGVVGSDVSGVGSARNTPAATEYGSTGQALFAYGYVSSVSSLKNLVTNVGVVGSDVTGVGTARSSVTGASYGGDKGVIAYGYTGGDDAVSVKNLVNNVGTIAADVSGVGTVRSGGAGASYGGDKAIFGFGNSNPADTTRIGVTNLVNSSGVIASDVSAVGTARHNLAATNYSISA